MVVSIAQAIASVHSLRAIGGRSDGHRIPIGGLGV